MSEKIAPNVYLLGTFGDPKLISVYLMTSDKICLVESGPSTLSEPILDAIRQAGYRNSDIDYIVVTHVHLDHAGGAWYLARKMHNAKILAFEPAVRHLVDPLRLRASASETLGELSHVYGTIEPLPNERLQPVHDGETMDLGGAELRFIATTGHAPHHMSIFEPRSGSLVTGDALGIYHHESNALVPASAPPSFDLAIALRNISTLKNLRPKHVLLPHYGFFKEADWLFELNLRVYRSWENFLSAKLNGTNTADDLLEEFARQFSEYRSMVNDPLRRRMMQVDVEGFLSYLAKRRSRS